MIKKVAPDIGFDLGTCNSTVYLEGRGVVLDEPSIVACCNRGADFGRILACGLAAQEHRNRKSDGIVINSPITAGVISNFEQARALLYYLLNRLPQRSQLIRSRALFCIPTNATAVEERALTEAAFDVGAGEVYLVPKPLLCGLGAGLPVSEVYGRVILDIGGGASTAAIIASGQVLASRTIPVGGRTLDNLIIDHARKQRRIKIDRWQAEEIKLKTGAATVYEPDKSVTITARDLVSEISAAFTFTQTEIVPLFAETLRSIVELVMRIVEQASPEIAEDIFDHGIALTGGSSLLPEIDLLLEQQTDLPVSLVERPRHAGARGLGMILEDWEQYRHMPVPIAA